MSDMPWVRFFPSDWLAGTRGMSAVETGIYITLVATMYERGEPVPEDHKRLARLCGASNSAFKAALDTLVAEGKIIRVDGGLWNNRVGRESEMRSEKSEVGRQAANARWSEKRKENNATDDANASATHSDRNANQKPEARVDTTSLRSVVARQRATRLSEDFQPDLDWAEGQGLSHSQALAEVAKFRDYWRGKSGRDAAKLDWPATWRNWVRTAVERLPRQRAGPPQKPMTALDVTKSLLRQMEATSEQPDRDPERDQFAAIGFSRHAQ